MPRRALPAALLLALALWVGTAPPAGAHVERPSTWPTYEAHVPSMRHRGPTSVVCRPDSASRIARLPSASARARNRRLLGRCRTGSIQTAIDRAANGTRIWVLPGVYREAASRRVPVDDPRCARDKVRTAEGSLAAGYRYQRRCPNAQNLIALVGDTDGDRRCDVHCRIQIVGSARRKDVLIEGDGRKLNVIRADRADGVLLANFTIQYSDFNNVYVLETAGFRIRNLVTRWSREYGVLSFTSQAGLYEKIDAYGSGDSGVYPGSGSQGRASERRCETYGTEIRHVDSHDNNLGYSGTAGDSVWVHDSKFRDNATGLATDSFASGHPGMPQHCAKWERNEIYGNNVNVFSAKRQAYCAKPLRERSLKIVCSAFQVPVGTGALIAGGNGNILSRNRIWDNHRNGTMLFWVPAFARGEEDPAKQRDTSFGNRYTGNVMGIDPEGRAKPNGTDFWWDGEGSGNCWSDNRTATGAPPTTDPASLPECGSEESFRFDEGDAAKLASLVPCSTWDPQTNPFPPGCDWFTSPDVPSASTRLATGRGGSGITARSVSGAGGQGVLRWDGDPSAVHNPALPADRLLAGRVRNAGTTPIELPADGLVVRGGDTRLPTSTAFLNTYLHRLYPFNATRGPRPRKEELRTGSRVALAPGQSAPLTVAWRGGGDARAAWSGGWLPLPR